MAKRNKVYGYARVSTVRQNEDRQIQALEAASVPSNNIFVDKQSGKDFEREQYKALLERLRPNDVLYVKSIDRLGRNYRDILVQWQTLTKEIGIDVVVLDMPLLDTRRCKDLLGTFISDVVLQILSFVAENERENIRQRQLEGIKAAKMRGVKFGRPRRELPERFRLIVRLYHQGYLTCVAAARVCKMPISTFRNCAERLFEMSERH